jgi:tetratricopeptide (TPR) repeat protein
MKITLSFLILLLLNLPSPLFTAFASEHKVSSTHASEGRADALRYYQSGNYQKAIDVWTEILQSNPKDAGTANNIAIAYRQLRQPGKALEYAQKAIELSPDYAHDYYTLGLAHYDLRNFEKAKEAFEEGIRRKFNPAASHYNLGLSFYNLRNYEKARESFLKAAELGYDPGPSYYQLGLTKYLLEDYKGAAEEFEKSVKNNPSTPGVHYYLGLCYRELKRPYGGKKAFEKERELKTKYSKDAYEEITKTEEKIIEHQGEILAPIAMFAIPLLLLAYSMKSKEFYRPNLSKSFLLVIFLIFLPLPFFLFVIPPLFVGILFYLYLFSAFMVIGFPAMIGTKMAYVGFFFSVIYLTAMVFLVYWAVCLLYKKVEKRIWLWVLAGCLISVSFFNIYGGATMGRQSRTNWIEMIKHVISSWVL